MSFTINDLLQTEVAKLKHVLACLHDWPKGRS
jgi:hypothetical protein